MWRLGGIQNWILETLQEGHDITLAFLLSGMNTGNLFSELNRRRRMRERALYAISRLKKRNLIQVTAGENGPKISLTSQGKKCFSQRVPALKLKRKKNWDGKWHIVMFDIPERQKKERKAFSAMIRNIGALSIQKSVYVFPFPWEKEVHELAAIYGISPWICYAIANQIDGADKLKQAFEI